MGRTYKDMRDVRREPVNGRVPAYVRPGGRAQAPRCGATRKVGFKTHEAALARAGEILSDDSRKATNRATAWRAYRCRFCGQWHLTSKA